MKSLATVLGTFIFALFVENFTRIIIIIYKQQDMILSGIEALPGSAWVLALFATVATATWLAGMLTITIVPYAPIKHLSALFALMLIWRLSEYMYLSSETPVWYIPSIILCQFLALFLTQLPKIKALD